ncbi:hypothetical protein ABG768_019043 [Culter alburnus]|uniref:Galectin n=1 Tax=Culter alburnus TaxID=194366 RepID=A0AAW2AV13_CULAL
MMVTVFGQVKADADRFQLDLQSGSDIVLHFNPRYEGGSGYVVHNTYQNRNWGSEERKNETPFPRGQTFVLQILTTQESYKISTNGKPFSEYKHRMPFSSVDSICIGGTVELSLVAFQSLAPHHPTPPGSFMVPYKSIIRGGLQPGKVIVAQGIISSQAKRIEFNLHHKSGIAFHYNPRFDENVVVRNTFEDGKWRDKDERSGPMPFKRGQPFLVTIFCSHDHYKVFVNGEETHTFNHRFTELGEIDVLKVSGDMELTFVQP